MSSILLTSNGFCTEEIIAQFKMLLPGNQNYKIAIITAASAQKEKPYAYADKAQQDFYFMGFSQVDVLDVENEHSHVLEQYNIIYLCGDNPYLLLFHMRENGMGTKLKEMAINENIIIVGASAGTVILGEHIDHLNLFVPHMDDMNVTALQALGISKATILPHCDHEDIFSDEKGRTVEQRLSLFEFKYKKVITRLKEKDYAIDLHLKRW